MSQKKEKELPSLRKTPLHFLSRDEAELAIRPPRLLVTVRADL
jgi:hypothetical protein